MATKRLSAYNIDPTTKELLQAMLADIQNAGVAAAVATDLANIRATLVTLKADVNAHRAAIVALTAKLDLDAGVTDVNYAATCDPVADTTAAPAAITAVPVASAQVIA